MVDVVVRNRRRMLLVDARPDLRPLVVRAGSGLKGEDSYRELLGLILAQAFQDGMSALKLGVDRNMQAVYLRYFGPAGVPNARWWDMTAPPPEAYSGLVKAAVEATAFAPGVDPRGTIHAEINRQVVDVSVEFANWYELTLAWSVAGCARAPEEGAHVVG